MIALGLLLLLVGVIVAVLVERNIGIVLVLIGAVLMVVAYVPLT